MIRKWSGKNVQGVFYLYISGSVKAIKSILMIAEDLRANAIHFIAPNVVFILAKNHKDYVYAKTSLTIGDSVLVPRGTYRNMHLYIKAARRGFKDEKSIFYEEKITGATYTSDKVYFNFSESLVIETELPSLPLRKRVEFKLEDTMTSSYDLATPYLRLSTVTFEELHSVLLNNKKKYRYQGSNSVDNTIRIQNNQLILSFTHSEQENNYIPENQMFAVQKDSEEIPFPFSDQAFYLLRWLSRATWIEEFILLPRATYCLTEGYNGDMVAKVRMSLYPEKEKE